MAVNKKKLNPNQFYLPLGDLDSDWKPLTELPDLHGPQAWDTETSDPDLKKYGPGWFPGGRGHIVGYSIACDNVKTYIPIRHPSGFNFPEDQVKRWVRAQMKKPVPKIFANGPYDLGWMRREDIHVQDEHVHDIQIQAPLIDEHRRTYSLDNLGFDYLGERKDETVLNRMLRAAGFADKGGLCFLPSEAVGPYAEQDAGLTLKIWRYFNTIIKEQSLEQIYELERSLIPVTFQMRWHGMPVDVDKTVQLRSKWLKEIQHLIDLVKKETRIPITAWDASSIAMALKVEGIECERNTDGSPSVRQEWLAGFDNPIAQAVLRIRKLDKACGTFLTNYILEHEVNGIVHANFNQLKTDADGALKGTVGGRYSSSDPNLQNIPSRDKEIGPAIRSCFIPYKGQKWLSADYSAQEPRLTVHFASILGFRGAREAVKAFQEDPFTDYHQMVADFCGISREMAKPINLGLAYGMGGAKLCRGLGLPTKMKSIYDKKTGREVMIEVAGDEGQAILDKVDKNAPFIRKLQKKCQDRAKEKRFIVTILGRRCRFPTTGYFDQKIKDAMNRLIQGSAADQTKKATQILYYEHKKLPLGSIHDELCFSVESNKEASMISEVMEGAVELNLPSIVEAKVGDNWGSVKKIPHRLKMKEAA